MCEDTVAQMMAGMYYVLVAFSDGDERVRGVCEDILDTIPHQNRPGFCARACFPARIRLC